MKFRTCLARAACAVMLGLAGVMAASSSAYACTAVYVGSEASDDGTIIMAKSNDCQAVWGNYMTVTDAVENEPGRTMPVDNDATVYAEIPAHTYKYTSTPWMDSTTAANGLGKDATVCTNECGVSMIMSITSFSNKAALEADPLVEHGLSEFTAVDLVTCQSATAKDAVKNLCGLIDRYGSSEVNIALISDQHEAWYVEMYGGHQYAAVKLPADAVAAFGNEFSLEYVSDYADSVVSSGLESVPKEKGFAVYGDNGQLNLLKTYAGQSVVTDYSHMRTWIGHKLLSASYGGYSSTDVYPLTFKADDKVSLGEVEQIMRNRFEGTEYSPDETGRTDMRVIGTDTALSVHITQTYPNLPANMACVTWESTGPAVYGVFVPMSNASTSVSRPYSLNQSADQAGVFDTDTYPYYRFKELCTLCVGADSYKVYGEPVRAYWQKAEAAMAKGMASVLSNASGLDGAQAATYITDYCNSMQQKAFDDAGTLLNDVRWYKSANCNTLTSARNPETGEVIDQQRALSPLEVTLSGDEYGAVPEVSTNVASTQGAAAGTDASAAQRRSRRTCAVVGIAVLGVSLVVCVAFIRKRRAS